MIALLALLLCAFAEAHPYNDSLTDYNININKTSGNQVVSYTSDWPEKRASGYTPSPTNWRALPTYTVLLDKSVTIPLQLSEHDLSTNVRSNVVFELTKSPIDHLGLWTEIPQTMTTLERDLSGTCQQIVSYLNQASELIIQSSQDASSCTFPPVSITELRHGGDITGFAEDRVLDYI